MLLKKLQLHILNEAASTAFFTLAKIAFSFFALGDGMKERQHLLT